MSIETELKKCAINLQQLTDAIVAQTAAMQMVRPVSGEIEADVLSKLPKTSIQPVIMGEELAAEHAAEMATDKPATVTGKVMPGLVMTKDELLSATIVTPVTTVETTVVDINREATTAVNPTPPMTMQEANAALQGIVAQLGDGGAGVRDLFKAHNAITLGQLAPEKYGAFVEEARALTGVQA